MDGPECTPPTVLVNIPAWLTFGCCKIGVSLGHGTDYTPLFLGSSFSSSVTLIFGGASPPLSSCDVSPSVSFLQHQRQLSNHGSCCEARYSSGEGEKERRSPTFKPTICLQIAIESTTIEAMGSHGRDHRCGIPRPPPLSLYWHWEEEEVVKASRPTLSSPMDPSLTAAVAGNTNKKKLTKQLSMMETTREVKWEKRRRQIQRQRSSMGLHETDTNLATGGGGACPGDGEASSNMERVTNRLTDEDLDELKGSMDLGFRFDEQKGGQDLCETLPALDLYFAVNRQLSVPKMRWSTSSALSLSATKSSPNLCGTPCPGSPSAHSNPMDSWKICSPGNLQISSF